MKLFFHALVVLLIMLVGAVNAAEPNFVKTTEIGIGKDKDGNSTDGVSIGYTDGLGRGLQSKVNISTLKTSENGVIPPTSTFLTTSTFYDDAGRPTIATKPFYENNCQGKFSPGDFNGINAILKAQYKKYLKTGFTDPIAYSETKYYADPLSRVYESAIPGVDNCVGTGGTSKVWYFGVGKTSKSFEYQTDISVFFNNGFITKKQGGGGGTDLDAADFVALYNYFQANTVTFSDGNNYLLTVTKDAGGKFSQVLKDLFGRTVATAVRKTIGENGLLISNSEYDILGNLLSETPPHVDGAVAAISDTKYLYNTLGQVIRKETPDGAIESYVYDDAGLLINKYLENEGSTVKSFSYTYGDLQRLESISEVIGRGGRTVVRYFYDNTETIAENATDYNIPTGIFTDLHNLKGRMVAAVSYSYVDNESHVIDLYSYDEDGNIEIKYKLVPGLPLQKITYTYDVHGKKISEAIEAGSTNFTKTYNYDFLGRLKEIVPSYDTEKKLAIYNYNTFGQLESKKLNGKILTTYKYTINDQVDAVFNGVGETQAAAVKRVEETITYQPDGNIDTTKTSYDGFTNAPSLISQYYAYDNLNRLVNVNSDPSTPKYVSSYNYDDVGRIKTKTEGLNSTISGYNYYDNTSRLQRAKTMSGDDYIYDCFGNLVIDKTKKMVIEYDWRNLPVKFSFYNSIPNAISADSDNKGNYKIDISGTEYTGSLADYMAEEVAKGDGVTRLLSSVTMLYDAGGNRVLKMESGL